MKTNIDPKALAAATGTTGSGNKPFWQSSQTDGQTVMGGGFKRDKKF